MVKKRGVEGGKRGIEDDDALDYGDGKGPMGLDGCSGHNDADKVDILDRIGDYLFLYMVRGVNNSKNNCNRRISGQKEGVFLNSRKPLIHHSASR